MKKKEDWQKKKVGTASLRIPPISFSLDLELVELSSQIGINNTTDFNEFLKTKSGLEVKEFDEKLKEHILKLCKIDGRTLSKEYRKYRAEKIKEEHPKKEIKERMKEYLDGKEYE